MRGATKRNGSHSITAVLALVVAMAALDWVTKGNPAGEGGGEFVGNPTDITPSKGVLSSPVLCACVAVIRAGDKNG
jgi:hypothetical protein